MNRLAKYLGYLLFIIGAAIILTAAFGETDSPESHWIRLLVILFLGILPSFLGALLIRKSLTAGPSDISSKVSIKVPHLYPFGRMQNILFDHSPTIRKLKYHSYDWRKAFCNVKETDKRKSSKIGKKAYEGLLLHYIEDFELSRAEKQDLDELAIFFGLSAKAQGQIKQRLGKRIIRELSKIYSEYSFNADLELESLYSICETFSLPGIFVDSVVRKKTNPKVRIGTKKKNQ